MGAGLVVLQALLADSVVADTPPLIGAFARLRS
jgi:hypothetical protein